MMAVRVVSNQSHVWRTDVQKKGAEVYLRLLLALVYFLLWMPVLFLLAPLRWLNPTLR